MKKIFLFKLRTEMTSKYEDKNFNLRKENQQRLTVIFRIINECVNDVFHHISRISGLP